MATGRLQNSEYISRIANFSVVGNGIALSVTNSSSSAQFPAITGVSGLPNTIPATDIMIINPGSVAAFITFGSTAPTAVIPTGSGGSAANGICIPAGVIMVLDKGTNNFVAGITSSGSTTLYLYQGMGS